MRGLELSFSQPDWTKKDERNFLPPGMVTAEQIFTLNVFRHHYSQYNPSPSAVDAIRRNETPVEIKIFFGDWCTDSKRQVPVFIKTLEAAANDRIQPKYINVSPDKKQPADLLRGWNIASVPTFIVLSHQKEVGRIIETPEISMDADFADILSKVKNQE